MNGSALDGATSAWNRQRVSLCGWGGWFLVRAAIFSFARFYHVYYLIMLGPAVAALTGIGAVTLWRRYRWLLPIALAATAWVELGIVVAAPTVRYWLTPSRTG